MLDARASAELQRRRQLPVVHREVTREEHESLHLLEPRARLVDIVDDSLHEPHDLRVVDERRQVARDAALGRPALDLRRVERDQGGDVGPTVAHDERLGDVFRRLEVVLDVLRGDVLSARGDDDVLLAVGDREEPVLVDRPDVSRLQPAVLGEGRGRRLGVLEVALEHRLAPDEDLAVRCDPDLGARQDGANGAEPVEVGAVRRARGRALGEPVALDQAYADPVEEVCDLPREWRPPGDGRP